MSEKNKTPAFPETPWSLIARQAGGQGDQAHSAMQNLLSLYWQPVYLTIRDGWDLDADSARNLCDQFLHQVLSPESLSRQSQSGGRFRTFVRSELLSFMQAPPKTDHAGNRSGIVFEELDIPASELSDPADVFDQQWVTVVFVRALKALSERYSGEREAPFTIFKAIDIDGEQKTIGEISAERGLSPVAGKAALTEARRFFRRKIIEQIYDYAADQQDAGDELAWLLG